MYSKNKKYFNLGSETEQPYVTWDISDGDYGSYGEIF